jgi:hypothetical protein
MKIRKKMIKNSVNSKKDLLKKILTMYVCYANKIIIWLKKVGLDEEEADECGSRIGEICNLFELSLPYC